MCGIVGYVEDSIHGELFLHKMNSEIIHRGPDQEGYHVEEGVGLGIRRLSIIDLDSGNQPISNEDESIWIVFNGEIYNFNNLRNELKAKGHNFRTRTDTECIVHLYEDYGTDCLRFLRGMFAFAIWDRNNNSLFLARDRLGKKPLYYCVTVSGLWFASELKSLRQIPNFSGEIDSLAVDTYLTYMYVPAPQSIFRGVKKLEPATWLIYNKSSHKLQTSRYWDLKFEPKNQLSKSNAVSRLKEILLDSTRIRMTADRPLGAFLSGGIDSSLVVAAMARQTNSPIKTFTIGFEDAKYDERQFAKLVATKYSTEHYELVVKPDIQNILPKLAWFYDEPYADSSSIPTYYLAQMASSHVIVALNGDGGDESFGGYQRYYATLFADKLKLLNKFGTASRLFTSLVPDSGNSKSYITKIKKFANAIESDPTDFYVNLMSAFNVKTKEQLYSTDFKLELEANQRIPYLKSVLDNIKSSNLLDKLLATDIKTYLPNDLLVKVDIATMANSLEARSPFLDHTLVEFASQLDSNLKIRRHSLKFLLKELAKQWLPPELINRPKMGFGVPISDWIRNDLHDFVRDYLTDSIAKQRGYFNPTYVKYLLDQHDLGKDNGTLIWILLQFELWNRAYQVV